MTELQKIELDILKDVIRVCDELSIRCYLVCGSALGAVKYRGFIPWDDDIDIGMFRDDYEKFCASASQMLSNYYFLQNYKTDRNFPAFYSKVRDSRTTYIETSVKNIDMHHGVYIDVFPLDGYPKEKREAKCLEMKKKILQHGLFCVFEKNTEYSWKAKVLYRVGRIFRCHKQSKYIVEKIDKLISSYSIGDSHLICNHGNWQGKLEYAPKEQYGNGIVMKFEDVDVCVPEKFDEYLSQKYGDWKSDLPKEKQVSHHSCIVCDLSNEYKKYM